MAIKKNSKTREKINSLLEQNELQQLLDGRNRARSLTCGPSSGGVIEVTMRSEYGTMWYAISPVEAIEFMTQLAASCGIEVAFRPRQDFAAWRAWDSSTPIHSNWIGTAPWQLEQQEKNALALPSSEDAKAQDPVEEGNLVDEDPPAVKKPRKASSKSSSNSRTNAAKQTRKS